MRMVNMNDREQKAAAKKFVAYWQDKGYEKGQSQPFWLSLLREVYGVERPEEYIKFEEQVHLDRASFIDGMIPATRVMIEQKSRGKKLRAGIRQSDGVLLTPFQQAKRYITELPVDRHPRYVITCNFQEFLIYDMNNPQGEPQSLKLADLPDECYRLNFLVDTKSAHIEEEEKVSIQAGALVGKLYDALKAKYIHDGNRETERQIAQNLNVLCVRLVFCLYAEDAGVFGSRMMFHDYLDKFRADARRALLDLFRILDTKPEDRSPYENPLLAAFPYVNGGLFADETIEIPRLDEEILDILLVDCSERFDWSAISPTIFGAAFESTLNPETRRSGGMHYTSVENIHKVIDPLFLDELKKELQDIEDQAKQSQRRGRLIAFQEKLANLTFFDPACGSGNFLTETYLSLRRLENEVISLLTGGKMVMGGLVNPIKVSISQFYGIEINDFAVTVAKAALWIAESQMMKETEALVNMDLDFLPLETNACIHEGNALRLDWNEIVPANQLNYIMGNPPFVGYTYQTAEQKTDIKNIFVDESGKNYKAIGKIDYVACWYFKAADYMKDTNIAAAFVSTNSITQGEQVAILWKPLAERYGLAILFARKTFKWNSESSSQAAVHCVIIGFTAAKTKMMPRRLFTGDRVELVDNINFYLLPTINVFVESKTAPFQDVPLMTTGNRPADGGNLIIEAEEYDDFIKKEPAAKKYIKKLVGAEEFINGKLRYCLWLKDANPAELRKMPSVMARIEACREARLKGADDRKKLANTPTLFRETMNPPTSIIVPSVSSENRRYVPLGFIDENTIATNLVLTIPDATLYHFGVLESNVHMAWLRVICGRLKSDYRYSKNIVYNNFPWPTPAETQKAKIQQTAQAILDARALYPEASLADLYDDLTMPPELRKAHQENDKAVMEAYGWNWRKMTEADCVAGLMKLYQTLATSR